METVITEVVHWILSAVASLHFTSSNQPTTKRRNAFFAMIIR